MKTHFTLGALKGTSTSGWAARFLFGGAVTALAGFIAKEYGPAVGGLFLAFPAVFPATSTLIETSEREHKIAKGKSGHMRGRLVAAVDARGAIWGSIGLMCFAAFAWKLLPGVNAAEILLAALVLWIVVSVAAWRAGRWARLNSHRRSHAAR
jgi:hypothetical protein